MRARIISGLALLALAACKPSPQVEVPSRARPTPPVRHVSPHAAPSPIRPIPVTTAGTSIQQERWANAKIKPSFSISVDKAVMLYLRTKDRYERVERMHANGVPSPVIFGLHMRESDNSFRCHLHEGSSLLGRTRYVPKGRIPAPAQPPFSWEDSALDALYVTDHMAGDWWSLTWSLNKIEGYNGYGYRKIGIPSPYLYAGTNIYERGKYTGDGRYNADAIDQQLGIVAVLKRLKERGVDVAFAP